MTKLEELTSGSIVNGILPNQSITIIEAKWHGSDVIELTYKDSNGHPYTELLFRDRESTLEILTEGRPWSFDGDGALLRLVSEAHRIRLAYLFDPLISDSCKVLSVFFVPLWFILKSSESQQESV
jgi:hypothetical protein